MRWVIIMCTCLFFLACDDEKNITTHVPPDSDVTYAQENSSFLCLERKVNFLENKPTGMKDFVIKIGTASVACNASDADVTTYAKAIIEKHGSNL